MIVQNKKNEKYLNNYLINKTLFFQIYYMNIHLNNKINKSKSNEN